MNKEKLELIIKIRKEAIKVLALNKGKDIKLVCYKTGGEDK